MKVLHLISGGDKGGAKTHVFTLLTALSKEIDVRVICFLEGVFYQEVQNLPIKSMLVKQRFRNDLTVVGKLIRHIRAERYDIIHAHGARANFIAIMLRPFIKLPMITTIHSDYRMDFTDSAYKMMLFTNLNSIALRFLDYYVCVSDSLRQMLTERGFDKDKVYTVYNAIDFGRRPVFAPKEEFLARYGIKAGGAADSRLYVGLVGRFVKVKGHEVFLKAAARLLKKLPDVVFLMAGDGPEEQAVRAFAHSLGIEKHVIFTGFVTDIYSFINAIDINVCSSFSEGFPYMLLEGALMRKPTVSTDVGGIKELIVDGETGFLVPSGDSGALAERLERLAGDAALRGRLGDNLYERGRAHFSTETMRRRHLEIYRDVIARERAAGRIYDVMLSGYYGFKNSGDDALLRVILDSLRKEREDLRVIVLSKTPRLTQERFNVRCVSRNNILKIRGLLRRTRLFVNGGGSNIQDITSTRSLVYYTSLINYAKSFGVPVMLYANGIGPVIRRWNKETARKALDNCDCITLRDRESIREIENLGAKCSNVSFTGDPAILIDPQRGEPLERILRAEGIAGARFFAVSMRQWKYNDARFVPKMAAFISEASRKYALLPVFIPMQTPDDDAISQEIIKLLEVPGRILSRPYEAAEIMGIMSRAETVIGMRLHSLIYAACVGTPVIGVVYDPKVKSFMEYIKQKTYLWCDDPDTGAMLSMLDDSLKNRAAAAATMEAEIGKMRELCLRDAKIAISYVDNRGQKPEAR